jgi:hypothetical protein
MSKLTDEERVELVVELDKINTEIKSVGGMIRVTTDKLETVTKAMRDDFFAGAERMPLGGFRTNPPVWEPSEFNLAELKKAHLRLRELEKRNSLEKQLGVTIR